MLPSSHSDGAIYSRSSVRNLDELDTQWIPRSSSLNTIISTHMEFSEDDEDVLDTVVDEDIIGTENTGAARIRDRPIRKKKPIEEITKRSKLSNHPSKTLSAGIRTRRKLRDATPDIDVDVE